MKRAFTLTEIMITAVIMGIIAVITIPSVMYRLQNQELYSRFVHVYTSLDAVSHFLIGKQGHVKDWNSQKCANIINHLNVARRCQKVKDCFVDRFFSQINGNRTDNYYPASNHKTIAELVDGSTILVNADGIQGYNYNCLIVIDTNGQKGPNRSGRDLFKLILKCDNLEPKIGGQRSCVKDDHNIDELRRLCARENFSGDASGYCAKLMLLERKMSY